MDLRRAALAFVACAACATEDGEPIGGDITLAIDGEPISPGFGAVIRAQNEPPKAMIVIGTRDIDCGTSLNATLKKGTYVTMLIDPAPGTQAAAHVSIVRVESSGTLINGAPDEVTIDAFDRRVTGNLVFETTDGVDDELTTLSAAGTFDVANCL
jgi:hypothetical protein